MGTPSGASELTYRVGVPCFSGLSDITEGTSGAPRDAGE